MQFRYLNDIPVKELHRCFNSTFIDYQTPMQLDKRQFRRKLHNDLVDLSLSVGAFDGDQLAGLILHGKTTIDGKVHLYNSGTGILPSHRGQRLTQRMYQWALPFLRKQSIRQIQLEVLTENVPARRSYENVGFKIHRSLACYRGPVSTVPLRQEYAIESFPVAETESLTTLWSWPPSWQNHFHAVRQAPTYYAAIAIRDGKQVIAYLLYYTITRRIAQFAVHPDYRRQQLGTCLFQYFTEQVSPNIFMLNQDESDEPTIRFLSGMGLQPFVRQYEMVLEGDPYRPD